MPGARPMIRLYRYIAKWIDNHLLVLLLGFIGTAMVVVVLWPYSVIDIPPGHLGVLWSRFGGGTVMDRVYTEGISVILPWDKMYLYDERLQAKAHKYRMLVADSLSIDVDINVVFHPNPFTLPYLHKYLGPKYADTVLLPVVGFETRNMFATFSPRTGLTEQRREVAQQIQDAVNRRLLQRFNPQGAPGGSRYIIVDDVLVAEISLPTAVADAISAKDAARERLATYDFLVEIERREAERRAIEAAGIKQFHDRAGDALTDAYLRFRTIEATQDLAKSPNSKIVVFGAGPGGLPLVLGADGLPLAVPPAAPIPGAPPAATAHPELPPGTPPGAQQPVPTARPVPATKPPAPK